MILLCLLFTGLLRTKGICKEYAAEGTPPHASQKRACTGPGLQSIHPPKTTGLGFSRGLFKSTNLTGGFPPKPPARSLMHSDHRRDGKKQQEYGGNQAGRLRLLFPRASCKTPKCRDN